MVTRALRISYSEHIDQEIEYQAQVFERHGYDNRQFRKVAVTISKNRKIDKKNKKENPKGNEENKRDFLPYIKGTTNKLAKTLGRKWLEVFFTPNTIRKLVDSLKDPIKPSACEGVYSVPCSCGMAYIGEMGRSIETRLKEQNADVRHNRYKKSALAKHSHITQHHICLENAMVITKEDNLTKRKVREKIEINMTQECLNRDDGTRLSNT